MEPYEEPIRYEMFCKREVQDFSDTLPKNRAIAGPQGYDKYVLGPVTWKLEYLFAKHLPGYCGGKNWSEMELELESLFTQGYTYVVQGDGSGFDRTQSHELKYFDRLVYDKVSESLHHTERDVFLLKSTSRYRKISGSVFAGGKIKLCAATVDGTVTSGNPDTTLMNTARMSLYVGFMVKEAAIDAKWWAKGDDFAIFIKNKFDYDRLQDQFNKYWCKKNEKLNEEFGLGLIIKFLTFGDFTSFDFCSTHLICDFNRKKFKIVRQWDRILNLGAYSMKALQYSKEEKNQYVADLMEAMECWAHNMPYYRDYMNQYKQLYAGNKKRNTIPGKEKTVLKQDKYEQIPDDKLIKATAYGRDFDYSLALRQSTLVIDDEVVYQFFVDKYGITRTDRLKIS